MRFVPLLILVSLTPTATAGYGELIAKLQPSDTEDGEGRFFGYSVALDGQTAVVGSPYHSDGGGQIFMFSSATGEPTGIIGGPGVTTSRHLGRHFDAADGLIAVSEIVWEGGRYLPQGLSSGVPIYDSTSGVLVDRAIIGESNIYYGASLSVNQGEVLIGAPPANSTFRDGAFYLYDTDDQSQRIFRVPNSSRSSYFGFMVGMNDHYLVTFDPFSAQLHRYDRETGERLPSLTLPEPDALSPSNWLPAIDFDDETMIVGSQTYGSALVYSLETGELLQTVTPSVGRFVLRESVAIDDGLALVSTRAQGDGRMHVFAFDVSTGEELGELIPDTPPLPIYGHSIDLQNGLALIGGYDLVPGGPTGEAYLFRLVPEPSTAGPLLIALLSSQAWRRSGSR